jgi:4-amino-4-deoxy-L-arabinose transferase-like glycosyltransferase
MLKVLKKNWMFFAGILVILALFSLRFINLTILPVFADEAIYIRWSQVMRAEETLRFLPLSDGKAPLYMWVTIPFLKLIGDPLFAGRVVSVFSGLGTLIGVGYLSWLLFKNKNVALAASAIYAVSPFTFFFDRMALADSLLSMFGIWTFIFSYKAITEKRLDFALLGGFALGGAWLAKTPALFFALLLPTIWLFAPWKKNLKTNLVVFLTSAFFTSVTAVIGYGFYNILRLGPNFHLIASRNLDYVYPLSHVLSSPLDPLKPFFIQSIQWILIMGPAVLVILWLYSWIFNARKIPKQLLVLTVWFLGPVLVQSEYAKVLTARYILFTIPYLIILASAAFLEARKNWVKILTFILAFLVSQSLVMNWKLIKNPYEAKLPGGERSGYLEEWTAGQGIKEASIIFSDEYNKNPSKKIVVGTEGYFGTLPDGLLIYMQKIPQITIIGVGLNFSEVPTSLIESQKAGNKTYLLINDDRFKGDPEKLGLKLINKYPKGIRPNGTFQSLLLFELTNKTLEL